MGSSVSQSNQLALRVAGPDPASRETVNLEASSSLDVRLQKSGLTNKPTTTHDNFYTPQNSLFYDCSPYLALNEERREIRLLRIFAPASYALHMRAHPQWEAKYTGQGLPGPLSTATSSKLHGTRSYLPYLKSIVACEILDKVATSRMDGQYCVLSYCAGKATDTKPILVDGIPFNAFANLERAIKLAYACWTSRNPGTELLLWVDQVCINQSNHLERTSQVGFMREIYRRSNETFSCLDMPGFETGLAWTCAAKGEKPGTEISASSDQQIFETVESLKDHLKDIFLSRQRLYEKNIITPWVTSLQAFIQNPLWCRAWIYQEFVASPRLRFLASSVSIPWGQLSVLVEFIYNGLEGFLASMLAESRAETLREESLRDQALEKQAQSRIHHQQAVQKYQSELDGDITATENKMKRIPVTSRLNSQYMAYKSLRKALRYVQQRLVTPNTEKGDYTCTWETDTIEDVKYYLTQYRKKIYTKVYTASPLSSYERHWILDIVWKNADALKTIRQLISEIPLGSPSAPKPASLHVEKHELLLKAIEVKRHEVEKLQTCLLRTRSLAIKSLLRTKMASRRSQDLKFHLQHSRNCDASDARDRIYAFIGLAHKEYNIVPDYTVDNTIVHTMMMTARKIIEYERSLDILEHTSQGRQRNGYFMPSWVPDWTSPETECGLRSYASTQIPNRGDAPFNASKGRRAEAEFRIAAADESNVDLLVEGCLVQYLDELNGPVQDFAGLQSFATPNGLHVIASKLALVDDEVWVLHGASMPVVLRPEGDGLYGFIGHALVCTQDLEVSDIMFGSRMDSAQQGNVDTKKIWII